LIAGGNNGLPGALVSAEFYDLVSASFIAAGSMIAARSQLSASALADGRALIAAGHECERR